MAKSNNHSFETRSVHLVSKATLLAVLALLQLCEGLLRDSSMYDTPRCDSNVKVNCDLSVYPEVEILDGQLVTINVDMTVFEPPAPGS